MTDKRRKHDQTPGIAFPVPAPGTLEIVQAFMNTIALGKKADDLATTRDLVRWFSSRALLHAGTRVTKEDRQRVIRVRDSLYTVLRAHSGAPVDQAGVRRLDLATCEVRFQVRFDEAGPEEFEPCSEGLDNALGVLLASIVAARRDGTWSSLKVCARKDCRRAFFDASRRGVGKWCTKRCGSVERGRAFRKGEKYKSYPTNKLRYYSYD